MISEAGLGAANLVNSIGINIDSANIE